MLPGSWGLRMLPKIDLSCIGPQEASPLRRVVIHGGDDRPWSPSRACWKAWLIGRLKTATTALSICTILLVLNLFAIIAAACLIITNGRSHAKWHAIGNPLPPTENFHGDATKMLGKKATIFKVTKLLHLRTHLGWRHCTKEMSPQDTCVDGSGLPGCRDGVSYLRAAISES